MLEVAKSRAFKKWLQNSSIKLPAKQRPDSAFFCMTI